MREARQVARNRMDDDLLVLEGKSPARLVAPPEQGAGKTR